MRMIPLSTKRGRIAPMPVAKESPHLRINGTYHNRSKFHARFRIKTNKAQRAITALMIPARLSRHGPIGMDTEVDDVVVLSKRTKQPNTRAINNADHHAFLGKVILCRIGRVCCIRTGYIVSP